MSIATRIAYEAAIRDITNVMPSDTLDVCGTNTGTDAEVGVVGRSHCLVAVHVMSSEPSRTKRRLSSMPLSVALKLSRVAVTEPQFGVLRV